MINQIELDNKYASYNEVLDNGLRIEKQISDILKKHNYTDKSKRKYLNMRRSYLPLLEDELKDYDLSTVRDIFNYCFRDWYYKNVTANSKRKKILVVRDFLNSYEFERFIMTENTVTSLGKSDSIKVLGFWEPVNVNANSMNQEDIY